MSVTAHVKPQIETREKEMETRASSESYCIFTAVFRRRFGI